MLTDWIHWLSSKSVDQLFLFLWALLLIDSPRYALLKILFCAWDFVRAVWYWLRGVREETAPAFCPTVCVLLSARNEGEHIEATLRSVWGSYPRLEIIVIDDGSTDGTRAIAEHFAREHAGVLVLARAERGGKASSVNFGLKYTLAEIVVILDSDSHLAPEALWRLVQPFRDERVGAVSGHLMPRQPFRNLVTWFQAYEYASSIFVGRILNARLGILGIVSGAWGAFRRSALERGKGSDVGPPEDLDLTLFLRKCGYQIAFAPYALCYTDVPETWLDFFKQRRRWEQGGAIRNHCRKHVDLGCFWNANFRWSNFWVLAENWLFNVICPVMILSWVVWFIYRAPPDGGYVLLTLYCGYLAVEAIQALSILFYTDNLKRDTLVSAIFPLVFFYQMSLLAVRLLGTVEEVFLRKSFEDDYVPRRVRETTWRW